MADQPSPIDRPSQPRIVLTFAGPGMAECTVQLQAIQPGQLHAAAWLLDQVARELRAADQAQAAQAANMAQSILRQPRRA